MQASPEVRLVGILRITRDGERYVPSVVLQRRCRAGSSHRAAIRQSGAPSRKGARWPASPSQQRQCAELFVWVRVWRHPRHPAAILLINRTVKPRGGAFWPYALIIGWCINGIYSWTLGFISIRGWPLSCCLCLWERLPPVGLRMFPASRCCGNHVHEGRQLGPARGVDGDRGAYRSFHRYRMIGSATSVLLPCNF